MNLASVERSPAPSCTRATSSIPTARRRSRTASAGPSAACSPRPTRAWRQTGDASRMQTECLLRGGARDPARGPRSIPAPRDARGRPTGRAADRTAGRWRARLHPGRGARGRRRAAPHLGGGDRARGRLGRRRHRRAARRASSALSFGFPARASWSRCAPPTARIAGLLRAHQHDRSTGEVDVSAERSATTSSGSSVGIVEHDAAGAAGAA